CGGGLLAPHVAGKGYRHVGVDLVESALRQARDHRVTPIPADATRLPVAAALRQARDHGVTPIRADVTRLPLADACADVVSAGELLEHVTDLRGVVAGLCRILRHGGVGVRDTV